MNITKHLLKETIQNLNDVDGETLEYIIRKLGMEEQILRQLFLKSDDFTIKNIIEERETFFGNI